MQNESDRFYSFFLLTFSSLTLLFLPSLPPFSSSPTTPPLPQFPNTRRFPRTTLQTASRATTCLGQGQRQADRSSRFVTCAHDYTRSTQKQHHNASLRETDGVSCPRCMSSTPILNSLGLEPGSSSTRSTQSATINQADQKLTQRSFHPQWQCFDSEPKIDYAKFATVAGLASAASARELMRVTKNKLKVE